MDQPDSQNPRKRARYDENEVNTAADLISAGEAFFEALGMHHRVLNYPGTLTHSISS